MDDIMMHHQGAQHEDSLGTGGVGMEKAAKGARGLEGGRWSARGMGYTTSDRLLRSRTLGAMGQVFSGTKQTVARSNIATAWRTRRQGIRNDGGYTAGARKKVAQTMANVKGDAPGTSLINRVGQRSLIRHNLREQRLKDARKQMNETMQLNAAAERAYNINSDGQYDFKEQKFTGKMSAAQKKYNEASKQFSNELSGMGLSRPEVVNTLRQAEEKWDEGKHLNTDSMTPPVASVHIVPHLWRIGQQSWTEKPRERRNKGIYAFHPFQINR